MLIDDVTITISAGKGGRGAVAFNKNLMSLGPVGGTGGKGGSVYAIGVSDLSVLNQFRYKKAVVAKNGEDGRDQFKDGSDAKDIMIRVPVGTRIHNLTNNSEIEILKIDEKVKLAQGGIGGRGNFHFRSSTNTTPMQFQKGLPGETFEVRLELKLIADVGFVGLPNAGKSSLLNELTNAKSKVGNYQFTTLEPNLGAYYDLIIADIPGLIEGSSGGKGLGIKFLRHIERTKILFHLVSAQSDAISKDYKTIRKELGTYEKSLLKKDEYLLLTKSDEVPSAELKKKLSAIKKLNKNAIAISVFDDDSIDKVKKILNAIADKKRAKK